VGMLGWSALPPEYTDLSTHLRSYIALRRPATPPVFGAVHARSTDWANPDAIEPLLLKSFSWGSYTLPYQIDNEVYAYVWRAAMYVIARDTPPTWFQLDLIVNHDLLELARNQSVISARQRPLSLKRLSGVQPVVALDDLVTLGQSLDWDSPLGRDARLY
jgi:hypothetical protein